MTGSNALLVQPRDRHLLTALDSMRIMDREQAMAVAGFHSVTRVNTRLLKLTKAGLLKRMFVGTQAGNRKALYALSTKGAALVGVRLWHLHRRQTERLIVDPFIEHQLLVNGVRITACHKPLPVGLTLKTWRVFSQPLAKSFALVPDGYFEIQQNTVHSMFLEVDRGTEGQRIWRKKVEEYLRLAASQEFAKGFDNKRFRVLVIANSERRIQSIRKTVRQITEKIFWFSTFTLTNAEGFWSAIWLRPQGDRRLPLF
jgi:hypothetical protein